MSDVVVVGGGLAGVTAALALSGPAVRANVEVTLIEPKVGIHDQAADQRALAVTQSSRRMFEAMGLWRAIAAHAEPLREIVVLETKAGEVESTELLQFNETDTAEGPTAYFIESAVLESILNERLAQDGKVSIVRERMKTLASGKCCADIITETDLKLRAQLVIGADGKKSKCREAVGIGLVGWTYPQTGIVALIEHQLPHCGRAFEQFMPAGPFAVLPLPGNRSSIVWTEDKDCAERFIAGSENTLVNELRSRLGGRLGKFALHGSPRTYELSMQIAKSFGKQRVALVGDAAHVIHPLAGLGFNLGMRDIAALAEAVVEDARLGLDIGSDTTLQKYERRRRLDTVMTAITTDWLNRLFSNDNEFLRLLRGWGLQAADHIKPVKRTLMREAAGLTGDLPKLMKGELL